MGFFSGRDIQAIEGLAGLAKRAVPSKDARRVVTAFIKGQEARGACPVPKAKGAPKVCNFESTGRTLKVRGVTVASRGAGVGHESIRVCANPNDTTPEVRQAANVILQRAKAGVSVRDLRKQGQGYRISGRKQRTGAAWPESGCINVKVAKKIAAAAYPALRAAIPSPEEVRKRGMTAAARILNMNRKKQKYKFGKPKSDAKKAKAAKRKASKAARHKSRKSR